MKKQFSEIKVGQQYKLTWSDNIFIKTEMVLVKGIELNCVPIKVVDEHSVHVEGKIYHTTDLVIVEEV